MTSYKPKILEIITLENNESFLRSKSIDVSNLSDPKIQNLIDDMVLTAKEKDGIGIAAPQIKKHLNIIIISKQGKKFIPIINPKITKISDEMDIQEEGCLSIPGIYKQVPRPIEVTISGLDRHGKKISISGKGLFSHVIQHELDHLKGVLFIDKALK